ncbi:membrane-bound lytic murein transglycosylase E [Myxococcaceae bacterium]|jgi:soluble lytic murein transglycosylase-like protein|nr:membrane-bound lytic murein transglycosylase E [Myxococcaceae bacterium]
MDGRARRCAGRWAVVLALFAGAPGPALGAGVYRYVAPDGSVHFTDAPTDPRFRPVQIPTSRVRFNRFPTAKLRAGDLSAATGRRSTREQYDALIAEVARLYDVPAALVKAVIHAESRFDPAAVSSKGAQGLMQLMPGTADMMGVEDPLEPRENLRGGVRYLRQLLDRFGDPVWAVAAYNAGPEAVDRHGGIPPYPETREYVRRVMTYYRDYGDLLP